MNPLTKRYSLNETKLGYRPNAILAAANSNNLNNQKYMKSKTRGISIKRTVKTVVVDDKGNEKEMMVKQWFPCRVNAAVPFDHKMLQ